ncbi:MAG TPA: DUF5915 domain-containing protein, partial [Pyrinomonadaceae bacterium]|nr:DUF5915 domain-containing protein [Pyrinomonadaceae bacterium]
NVRRGAPTPVSVAGETLEFEPEAFLVDVKSPEGYAAVEEGGYLVALNTTLTAELIVEGQARDVLRLVQNARKKANLAVNDHIRLGLDASGGLLQALRAQEDFIKTEGLVAELEYGRLYTSDYAETVELDGSSVTITLRRHNA